MADVLLICPIWCIYMWRLVEALATILRWWQDLTRSLFAQRANMLPPIHRRNLHTFLVLLFYFTLKQTKVDMKWKHFKNTLFLLGKLMFGALLMCSQVAAWDNIGFKGEVMAGVWTCVPLHRRLSCYPFGHHASYPPYSILFQKFSLLNGHIC